MSNKHYLAGRFALRTDVGRVRMTNEDRVGALINAHGNVLLVVCDGMGGANKGDYASSLASKFLLDSFASKSRFISPITALPWLVKKAREANELIYNEASNNKTYYGMGTTLSAALIMDAHLLILHAGDSRIYRINKYTSRLEQLTNDQTYVNYLYKTGQIKKEDMKIHPKRHVLMNAIGITPAANVDFFRLPYQNEQILLCSDGLYNNVSETAIESVLLTNDTPEEKVAKLISLANANGGSDNIGVVIWEAI